MPNLHSHAFQRAIAGRTGRVRRRRRQLLDVAAGDVRVSRPRRRRRVRGDRRAGVRRDAEGGLHGGRRISLRASRSRRPSRTRIRRSSRGASSPRQRTPASRSRCCRCSTRTRDSAARRRPRDSAASSTRSTRSRVSSRRLRATRLRSGVHARRRAAQPARGHAGRARRGRRAGAAGCADPHSRRRAGARGRRLRRLERRAAGASGCSTMRSVDARWCIVHATHMIARRRRARLAASGAVAGLAPTTEADLGDGTFAGARVSRRGRRLRRRQRLEHDHRSVRRAAPARVVAAARARARATCWPIDAATRSASRSTRRPREGGAQALAPARRRDRRRHARRLRRAESATIRRSPDCPPTRSSTRRSSARAGSPVRDVMVPGRWVVRDGRHPREDADASRAIARRWRGIAPA